jgi:septal ring factor EnvC (AmiA/AmiB activator)
MTNTELITELAYCASIEKRKLLSDAADALEAADKRIAEQQEQIAKLYILLNNRINEITELEAQIAELETVKCHCNLKENAELIARILDDDVDGKMYEMP